MVRVLTCRERRPLLLGTAVTFHVDPYRGLPHPNRRIEGKQSLRVPNWFWLLGKDANRQMRRRGVGHFAPLRHASFLFYNRIAHRAAPKVNILAPVAFHSSCSISSPTPSIGSFVLSTRPLVCSMRLLVLRSPIKSTLFSVLFPCYFFFLFLALSFSLSLSLSVSHSLTLLLSQLSSSFRYLAFLDPRSYYFSRLSNEGRVVHGQGACAYLSFSLSLYLSLFLFARLTLLSRSVRINYLFLFLFAYQGCH